MGIQSIGGVTSTAAPSSFNRPVFTYNNGYTHTYATTGQNQDCTYIPNNNSIIFGRDPQSGSDQTFISFSLSTNTFSASATLPIAVDPTAQFVTGHDGTLMFIHRTQIVSSTTPYYSTDNGSTWSQTGIAALTDPVGIVPISSKYKSATNNSDVVPFAYFSGQNTGNAFNKTASTNYTVTLTTEYGFTQNTGSSNWWRTIVPIRKGDDNFDITGYLELHHGGGGTAGSRLISTIATDNKRSTHFWSRVPEFPQNAVTSGYAYYNPSRPMSCIENRWFLQNGNGGIHLYDFYTKGYTSGAVAPELGRGLYGTRPIYISATKKLYIHNSSTKTMHVWDVTFE